MAAFGHFLDLLGSRYVRIWNGQQPGCRVGLAKTSQSRACRQHTGLAAKHDHILDLCITLKIPAFSCDWVPVSCLVSADSRGSVSCGIGNRRCAVGNSAKKKLYRPRYPH